MTTETATADLDFYCWRERVGDRLLVPCADPYVYEFAYDQMFASREDAIEFVEESDHYDPETWVLVHYVGTVVDTGTGAE